MPDVGRILLFGPAGRAGLHGKTRPTDYGQSRNALYVVSADGQRFLINTIPEEAGATPITLVVNWAAGLKK